MPTPINAKPNAAPDNTVQMPTIKPRIWLGALVVCAVGIVGGVGSMSAAAVGAALGLLNLWAIGRLVSRALVLLRSDDDSEAADAHACARPSA